MIVFICLCDGARIEKKRNKTVQLFYTTTLLTKAIAKYILYIQCIYSISDFDSMKARGAYANID